MKSTIRKSTYKAIYRLLDRVSPVNYDCGTLCGAACCVVGKDDKSADFDYGIYLYPGEEKIYDGMEDWIEWTTERAEDYDFPESWHGKVYFVRCKNPPFCNRPKRPLQCRFYPLAPHIDENDELHLIYSTVDTPYRCPLVADEMELQPDFVQATYTVWKHLIRDPLIYDLVIMDSDDRIYDDVPFTIVK